MDGYVNKKMEYFCFPLVKMWTSFSLLLGKYFRASKNVASDLLNLCNRLLRCQRRVDHWAKERCIRYAHTGQLAITKGFGALVQAISNIAEYKTLFCCIKFLYTHNFFSHPGLSRARVYRFFASFSFKLIHVLGNE